MNKFFSFLLLLVLINGTSFAQKTYLFPKEIAPLITSEWGQDNPYNKMCPWETIDSVKKHAYAGCGPLVMSQVIRYNRYSSKISLQKAALEWDDMPNRLQDTSSSRHINEVATLIRHCGTAASTVYGQSASSTKLNSVIFGLKKYFGYSRYAHIAERAGYLGADGSKEWKSLIYKELQAGRPVIMRGEKNSHYAHVFIIDGCRDSTVHVNWGWGGKRNGYFDPDTLDGFRYNQNMIVDMGNSSYQPSPKVIKTIRGGQIYKNITTADWINLRHLKVVGNINPSDVSLLRQLAGGGKKGERNGNVSSLDLSEAVILTLPDSAFYGCKNLTYVSLPFTLPEIGRAAFMNCIKLNNIQIHSMVGVIKSNAFMGCFNLLDVKLPSSLKTIGANVFNSCTGLEKMVIPLSVIKIESGAFAYAKGLKQLSISRKIKIDNNIIKGTSVKKINRI